jgi:hypothetical protein
MKIIRTIRKAVEIEAMINSKSEQLQEQFFGGSSSTKFNRFSGAFVLVS